MGNHIGFFGGTFDPFHLGHLNLCIEMMEKRGLSSIWVCPAGINPFKQEKEQTAAHHRLEMARLGVGGLFRVLDLEILREGPSYTFDTLEALGPSQFSLILGEDALPGLHRWHRIEELIQKVPLLIGSRKGEKLESIPGSPALLEAIRAGLTPTRTLEISATEIRQRLQQGRICRHLLPQEVLDYIKTYNLYYTHEK